ncbi:MAG: hypothetical protein K2X27_13765, partial [Candidatus Obscuribacterales bacterium]|nr:hypothetical protein [Candidatus Obscuribacterales bacterium]
AVFVNVGATLGEGFRALPALKAYSINLVGSIAGALLLALVSLFNSPPPVWILIAGLITRQLVKSKLLPILTSIFVAAACMTTLSSHWSPYSKLDIIPVQEAQNSALGKGNYVLNSNNHYFHFAVHMIPDEKMETFRAEAKSPQSEILKHYFDFLHVPFLCAKTHKKVLILGGGSGNDVSYALKHGAQHVDVVEIDPVISSLGKTLHPDRPYLDPRVSLHTEDARTFLRYSKEKFDLIEFAYLDPGSTLSTASFLRVDNFVYTVESIKSALAHLDNGGLLSISFATGAKHPVTRRLYQNIREAQGKAPRAYVDDEWESVLLLAGPAADKIQLAPENINKLRPWPNEGERSSSTLSTDDWPFLYLEYDKSGMILHFAILLLAVILPALFLARAQKEDIGDGACWNMLFLGQAFMLIETKSITQLSLFFGATWLVSSAVIFSVLLLAYFANFCAGKMKSNKIQPFYICLAAALSLDYFFKVPASADFHPYMLASIATLIACLPIFFGGLIFSLCFRQAKDPARLLSANLLGVALGGLTENLCLLTGIKGLVLVAMVIYGLSYLVLDNKLKTTEIA